MDNQQNGLIDITKLGKVYTTEAGSIPVLREVNLRVGPGEMVAVMGPSGSGKSTLLYILGLFQAPSYGNYYFDGQDVLSLNRAAQAEFRRHRVGFVLQSADLLQNSTVYENLEFPLIYSGLKRRVRPKRIAEALDRVGMASRIQHPSNRLSGGEKQRVAIARALVNKPQCVLADEPTGALDKDNTELVLGIFEQIVSSDRTALVIITHDPEVAGRCSRIYLMDDGMLMEKHNTSDIRPAGPA